MRIKIFSSSTHICVCNNLYDIIFLQKIDISVFETNIRFIGGFLTCYAMTGDTVFRDKADYIAKKLLPAFQTPTGIPYSLVNLKSGVSIIFKLV